MKTMAPKKAPQAKLTPAAASKIRAKAAKMMKLPPGDKDSAAGAAT